MAEELSTVDLIGLKDAPYAIFPIRDLSWQNYAEIEAWLRDDSRKGFYASIFERGGDMGVLHRVYRITDPNTAVEFKMRWM